MEHKKIEYVHIIRAATHRAWKGLGVKPVALIVGEKKSQSMKANTTRKLEAMQRTKAFFLEKQDEVWKFFCKTCHHLCFTVLSSCQPIAL